MFESLEPRALFSVQLHEGTLFVNGTNGDDQITFERGEGTLTVSVNGEQTVVNARLIRFLNVHAMAGDDSVILGRMTLRTSINGGAGDDTLSGGHGGDIIFGGAGSDVIHALLGDDWVDGGRLHDPGASAPFEPDADPDTISGGRGADTVRAPESNDVPTDFEDTVTDGWAPVYLRPEFTRISLVAGENGTTVARVLTGFEDVGLTLHLLDVYRRGNEIFVVTEGRDGSRPSDAGVTGAKVNANLGVLPAGAYRVRVIDRWGGTVAARRFEASVAPVQIIAPQRVTLEVEETDGVWYGISEVTVPDVGYHSTLGTVSRSGNVFTVEVTGSDRPDGETILGSDTSRRFSNLGELTAGNYVFRLTSGEQEIKTLNFAVP